MRQHIVPVLVVLATVLIGSAHADDASPAERLATLHWLAGSWRGGHGSGTWEAVYSSAAGGEVLSVNKEIRDGHVVSFEFERFFVQDGAVVMTPYVGGRRSVAFQLTTLDREARRAVFENPEHDFPQRIEYHRAAEDRLVITVTALKDGRHEGFRLDLARVAAGSAPPRPDGGATPAALLERLATAARVRDLEAFVACVVPEGRPKLSHAIGVIIPQFAIQMGSVAAEGAEALGEDATEEQALVAEIKRRFESLLEKYGLESVSEPSVEATEEDALAPFRDIDHPAFLRDALDVMQPYWDANADGDESVRNPLLKFAFDVTSVEETGDRALVHMRDDPGAPSVLLVRVDGRWFLSLDAPENG
ncbi:MAG: DUF6265 family protein [Planctomycetota bacterium]|jgi:hypothetical protein